MTSFITAIGEALAEATKNDQTFKSAEACYNAVFRSEPHLISELDEDDKRDLIRQTKVAILEQRGISQPEPDYFGGDDDESFYATEQLWDAYDEELDKVQVEIKDTDSFCYLCNYKGEGEGFALFEHVKSLPVFKSKAESFLLFAE